MEDDKDRISLTLPRKTGYGMKVHFFRRGDHA